MQYFHVNHLALIVAAAIQWVIGALWYGLIFGKAWRQLVGMKGGEKPKNPWAPMVLSFVASFVLCFVEVHLIRWAGGTTFSRGAFVGLVCGLGFVVPPLLTQHVYENRPFKLFGINACYWLVAMIVSGGVLAVWQ